MKSLKRFFNWLFRRKKPERCFFISEVKMGIMPVNKRHIVPIIYLRGKGPEVKGVIK
jgi:hypothetical protein